MTMPNPENSDIYLKDLYISKYQDITNSIKWNTDIGSPHTGNPLNSNNNNNLTIPLNSNNSTPSGKLSILNYNPKIVEWYKQYENLDFDKGGIFYNDDAMDKLGPSATCIEALYFICEKSFQLFWNFFLQGLFVWISRRVSGLVDEDNNGTKGKKSRRASGYFGWGKIMILQPTKVTERFRTELTNLSIVGALFLTITIPLINSPPPTILIPFADGQNYQWLFVLLLGSAIAGQITTVTTSLSMITSLTKCEVEGTVSGLNFVKSIFNPYNGLTGAIGPALYIGGAFSWTTTLFVTILIASNTYTYPNTIWMLYLIIELYAFGAYIIVLTLGVMAEIKCSKSELEKFCKNPTEYYNEYIDDDKSK